MVYIGFEFACDAPIANLQACKLLYAFRPSTTEPPVHPQPLTLNPTQVWHTVKSEHDDFDEGAASRQIAKCDPFLA